MSELTGETEPPTWAAYIAALKALDVKRDEARDLRRKLVALAADWDQISVRPHSAYSYCARTLLETLGGDARGEMTE